MQNELIQLVRNIKGIPQGVSGFSIPVRTSGGTQIGALKPIDAQLSRNPEVIRKLTAWRRDFMQFFLTQFSASEQRTADWLADVVIPSDDRILFLICDPQNRWVGNFGVCDFRPGSAELDNLIRGEVVDVPQFILLSELAMLSWLYHGLGMDSVHLHVFSTNSRTISLHTRAGFREKRRHNLSKVKAANEIRYLVDSPEGEPADFQYIEMGMQQADFNRVNPWVHAVYADVWA